MLEDFDRRESQVRGSSKTADGNPRDDSGQ